MFSWISRMFDAVSGRIDSTVAGWVRDLVSGLYGFLHTIFGHVIGGWENLYHDVSGFIDRAIQLSVHVLVVLATILHHVIPTLHRLLSDFIRMVFKYARDVYHFTVTAIDDLRKWTQAALNDLHRFVVNDVYDPLFKSLTGAWHWITHEGALVFFYITHAPQLVDLFWDALIAKLEAEAWNIAQKLGSFALSLVVRNLGRFVSLVEDILNAVF